MDKMFDSKRVIEINNLGRFYVYGAPTYSVIEMPSKEPQFWGWIVVSDAVLAKTTPETVGRFNAIYKLNEFNHPVAKLLIKSKEMAEEICYAANRIRI